jgi:YidC/Oxa1 family membrane protein insertase
MHPPLANIFQPLVNVFDAILGVFYDDVGLGWGLAVIALTLLIRSLLLPLTLKQLRSMYRMAQFTPEIKKLREKHGSDPRRLQRETMAFYRENRINPLASVLPVVAQLPIFLSLYFMLRTDLRHDICPGINPPGTSNPQSCGETAASHFLFIPDLTSRATGRSRRADRALRRLAALLVPALGEPDDGQDATDDPHGAALLLHRDRLAAAGRPARVLDHHQHVDERPERDRPQAPGPPTPGGAGRASGSRRTRRAR